MLPVPPLHSQATPHPALVLGSPRYARAKTNGLDSTGGRPAGEQEDSRPAWLMGAIHHDQRAGGAGP